MKREQFTFYRSFWESLKELPKKDQLPFVFAICSYVFEEETKPITGAAKSAFVLVKPILDKASKKAASGKQGGIKPKANNKQMESKTEANEKQTESHIQVEVEKEIEIENDSYYIKNNDANKKAAAVIDDFLNRINPTPSPSCLHTLSGYAVKLGTAVCKRAFDIALDNRKTNWPYIQAILQDKLENGVQCLADWDELDKKRKELKKHGKSGNAASGGGHEEGAGRDWGIASTEL